MHDSFVWIGNSSCREAPQGEESSAQFIICASNTLGTVFAGTGVNWEPHFTKNPTRDLPCRALDHLTKDYFFFFFQMKNLLELDFIWSWNAFKSAYFWGTGCRVWQRSPLWLSWFSQTEFIGIWALTESPFTLQGTTFVLEPTNTGLT